MITNYIRFYILFIYYLYKFSFKINTNPFFNVKLFSRILKKKNLLFKKKGRVNILSSKRVIFSLKKKKFKKFKSKKIERGNFFIKKLLYKSLIYNRKILRLFFFFNKKVRQRKITRTIFLNQKKKLSTNSSYGYTVLNILIKSNMFLNLKDILIYINNNNIYINNKLTNKFYHELNVGDCIQFKISYTLYKYILFCKKIVKKYVKIHRYNSWKFFKQKVLKKKKFLKPKKKKFPKYLEILFLFKVNTPRFIEIDFLTLTIFLLKKQKHLHVSSFFLRKFFSFTLFPLYNFKKIN